MVWKIRLYALFDLKLTDTVRVRSVFFVTESVSLAFFFAMVFLSSFFVQAIYKGILWQ